MSQRNLEELLFHMRTVAGKATSEWARNFARSVLKQSKKKAWRPTEKQHAVMNRIVAELFSQPDEEIELIER